MPAASTALAAWKRNTHTTTCCTTTRYDVISCMTTRAQLGCCHIAYTHLRADAFAGTGAGEAHIPCMRSPPCAQKAHAWCKRQGAFQATGGMQVSASCAAPSDQILWQSVAATGANTLHGQYQPTVMSAQSCVSKAVRPHQ